MYVSTGTGLLRSARMPLAADLPDLPNVTTDPASWLSWLVAVWQVPVLADAVHVASPDLTRAVRTVLSEDQPTPAEIRRVSTAVLHYLLRGQYRATPFGLFAATAPITVGNRCLVPDLTRENITVRPDALWLDALLDLLHSNPNIVEHLTVVVDPTCEAGPDLVVVPHAPGRVQPQQIRARATAPLLDLLVFAARPVPVALAADHLLQAYPGTPRVTVVASIAAAVRGGLLHSNLRPSSLQGFPLHHIREVLDRTGAGTDDPTVVALKQIDDVLTAPAGDGRDQAVQLMGQVAAAVRYPLMIDVHCPEPVEMPKRLAQDVAGALDVMVRTSTHPQGAPAWREYRAKFFHRYSLGVLVPVLELLDPITGLGYPAGFRDSPFERPVPPLTKRDSYLLARIQQVIRDGGTELLLHESDLAGLQTRAPEQILPTAEVTVAVHATSRTAIDRGDYELLVQGLGSGAGTLTGRFLPLLSPAERQRILDVHLGAPTLDDAAIRVQICSPPLRRPARNLALSIQLAPEILAIGEHTDQTSMWLNELAVGATADRLYLVHLPTMRRIEPFLPNALDPRAATHPLAQFLVELPRSHATVSVPFDWGAAADLPFLPRVRYGRVVLSPARWRVTTADLAATTDPAEAVQAWRRRQGIPTTVLAGDTDQRLRLNLAEPVHRSLLAQLIVRRGTLIVQEAPDDHAHGWLGRAGQLTLSFTATQPQAAAPSRIFGPVTADPADTRWPGAANTVLLRIDTDTDRTRDVFTAGLRVLLDTCEHVQRWWFTRYRDPRQHLRVRVTLHRPDQFGDFAALIATWAAQAHRARLVANVSWHTDRPETGRYGTGAVLQAAEAFFAADSSAALAQDSRGRDPFEREALLLTSLFDITRRVIPHELDALQLWSGAGTRTSGPGLDRRVRGLALSLTGRETHLGSIAGGGSVASTWQTRAGALVDYAEALRNVGRDPVVAVLPVLLHMHHIRAFGADPDHEDLIQRGVREIAHSLLVRRRTSS